MAEHIREVVVTIEVDTNKSTYKKRLTWDGDATHEALARRVVEALDELTEIS